MNQPRRAALTVISLLALLLLCEAGASQAYPLLHFTPRVKLRRATAPTTAECEAELRMACYRPAQIQTAYNMKALFAQGRARRS